MGLALSVRSAEDVVVLLELLSELPSSAEVVAVGARERARRVAELLPLPSGPRSWQHRAESTIEIGDEEATEVVELLELFAALPSTPPPVAADARRHAEALARELPER